jgi:hypothetical protein
MPEIAVVHLVRSSNAIGLFESFLAAYRNFDAGIEHDLIIIFKGFSSDDENTGHYVERLAGLSYRPFFFPDVGFDIGAYFATAQSFPHTFFCFLNSYAEPLASGWLAMLYGHGLRERVGVVGATGSYESPRSYGAAYEGLPRNRYLLALRIRLEWLFPGWLPAGTGPDSGWLPHLMDFQPFPNPHVRTNGFLIRRDLMIRLKRPRFLNKFECHKFECGRQSMTRQLLTKGLEPLVVGRDGRSYGMEQWYESRTFRSGDQSNLLISDNHTRYYDVAESEECRRIAGLAWGEKRASAEGLAGRSKVCPAGKLDA